jgi:type I restriction enzyme M protein
LDGRRLLHGIDNPNLDYKDTLSKRFQESERYDVVLANPPFKGSIDKGDINETLGTRSGGPVTLCVTKCQGDPVLRRSGR